jgi:hypothetical protein
MMVGVDSVWHQSLVVLVTTKFPVRFEAIDFVLSSLLSSARSQRLRLFPNDPPVGCDLLKSCHVAAAQNFEWVLLSLSTSVEREGGGKLGSQLCR